MQLLYLGTGAAEGIPALFCGCDYCRRAREGKEPVRSRAQLLIGEELCIDFPPDAFFHAANFGVELSAISHLLVTHAHMDHFDPSAFILRGYKYAAGMKAPVLHIYGNREVLEVFEEGTRREMKPAVRETVSLHLARAFEPFSCGKYTVHPLKAQHSSSDPLLYFIEGEKNVLHLTDTGTLPTDSSDYLRALGKRCDVINFDCTFLLSPTEKGARHMGLDENLRVLSYLKEMGAADEKTVCVVTHFSHNARPTKEALSEARKLGFLPAYDGMRLNI